MLFGKGFKGVPLEIALAHLEGHVLAKGGAGGQGKNCGTA